MNNQASALTGVHGEKVALSDVSVSASLQDLLSEVTVSQTYRNDEDTNIEAVYTFPLPLEAVLLDLQVEIGGRVLKGIVAEKKEAEEQYEDAVASGDAAVMLEAIEPGLYTMNVGNLLPNESATITFKYALLYRWVGDRLRFFLPTTVAPRFGESPHQPHQAPEHSLTVENQFSLEVKVSGCLRDAQFICPSHQVEEVKLEDGIAFRLRQSKAVMDRDFILNVQAPQAERCFAVRGADVDGVAVVASFQPFFPGLKQLRPLDLAVVIDCSGSMQGDSIAQAKQALAGILDALQPEDRMTLIAFGNTFKELSAKPLSCTKSNVDKAKCFAESLEANMGGTEVGKALRAAYTALSGSESAEIFLVTDGEVSGWESVVDEATRAGHRIFTVGVGASVTEAFVRSLASSSGGECELVSPREGMSDRVIRHFDRMRSPRAKRVDIRWPDGAKDVVRASSGAVFDGDTLVACARFDKEHVGGQVVLELETEAGEVVRHELSIGQSKLASQEGSLSTVARIAASSRLKTMKSAEGLQTALRYRLISPWTNWLVVAERSEEDKAKVLPSLRKVPQTLAAGWGGAGLVAYCPADAAEPSAARRADLALPSEARREGKARPVEEMYSARMDLDMPAFLRKTSVDSFVPAQFSADPVVGLITLIEQDPARLEIDRVILLLEEAQLAQSFDDVFTLAKTLGIRPEIVAVIALALLLRRAPHSKCSDSARGALTRFDDQAQGMIDCLQDMNHSSVRLIRATEGGASMAFFEGDVSSLVIGMISRFAKYSRLVSDIRKIARSIVSELPAAPFEKYELIALLTVNDSKRELTHGQIIEAAAAMIKKYGYQWAVLLPVNMSPEQLQLRKSMKRAVFEAVKPRHSNPSMVWSRFKAYAKDLGFKQNGAA